MNAPLIIGSATPTPLLNNGELDVGSLENVVDQHLRLGVTGLFVAGTCGEGPFLPADQRWELVRSVARLANRRLTVSVQVSDTSAARVGENIARAQAAGADAVVIAPPWLERFSNREFVRRYFLEPLDRAPLPVGLYAMRGPAALDVALWTELAGHPRVRFIKDSTGAVETMSALVAVKSRRPDLVLQTGNEFDVLGAVRAGYDGALVGTGILIGGLIRRALDAQRAGAPVEATVWQHRANVFLYDLFGRDLSLWLGGLKYALVRLGVFRSAFMHLCYPVTAADRARIDAALEREQEFIRPGGRA